MSADVPNATATLVIRPWRVRWVAWVGAVVLFAAMVAVAVYLREVPTGVHFRFADQVAMVVLGLLMAGGILLLAMPRIRADARTVQVRNVLFTRTLAWEDVVEVGFPDGQPWARLELPDDEYLPLLAIQAVDRDRAVSAINGLRALFDDHRVSQESG